MVTECENPNCLCHDVAKEEAEKEVSPQTNATFTKLTPGPDAGPTDNIATPEGNFPDYLG